MKYATKGKFLIVFQNLCFISIEKDLSGSDNDSALSSAPPSLSPQPGTQSNSPDVWQTVSIDSSFWFLIWKTTVNEELKKQRKNWKEEIELKNEYDIFIQKEKFHFECKTEMIIAKKVRSKKEIL